MPQPPRTTQAVWLAFTNPVPTVVVTSDPVTATPMAEPNWRLL